MIFLDLILVAGLVVVAVYLRNNLIALCIELLVVVGLFLMGIGTVWYLFVMVLVLLVLFITSSDIREGILKSLIFYVQTCGLLLSGLYSWGSIDFDVAITVLRRNGLECYIPYNTVTRFWLIMCLPVIIALACTVILFVGRYRIKRKKEAVDQLHDHEQDGHSHFIQPSAKWTLQCVRICLFLWYILYFEIAAAVSALL